MLRQARTSMAFALLASAMVVAACGGDEGTIPTENGNEMLATLDDIQSDVDDRDCTAAQTDASQFIALVDQLPAEVGVKTKKALFDAGRNLADLAQDPEQCDEPDSENFTPDTGTTGAFNFEGDG
jgi:hypothetical protein